MGARDRSPSRKAPCWLCLPGRGVGLGDIWMTRGRAGSCSEGGKERRAGQNPQSWGGRRGLSTLAGGTEASQGARLPWLGLGSAHHVQHRPCGLGRGRAHAPSAGWRLEGFWSSQDTGLWLCPLLTGPAAGQWPPMDNECRPLQPYLPSGSLPRAGLQAQSFWGLWACGSRASEPPMGPVHPGQVLQTCPGTWDPCPSLP